MKKYLNIDILFPILIIDEGGYTIVENIIDFTTTKDSLIDIFRKSEDYVLDSNGIYFKRTTNVEFLHYSNFFKGFSLKFAGFGKCRVRKELIMIKKFDINELKNMALSFLNFYKKIGAGSKEDFIKTENRINQLSNREEIVRLVMNNLFEK